MFWIRMNLRCDHPSVLPAMHSKYISISYLNNATPKHGRNKVRKLATYRVKVKQTWICTKVSVRGLCRHLPRSSHLSCTGGLNLGFRSQSACWWSGKFSRLLTFRCIVSPTGNKNERSSLLPVNSGKLISLQNIKSYQSVLTVLHLKGPL